MTSTLRSLQYGAAATSTIELNQYWTLLHAVVFGKTTNASRPFIADS